MENYAASAKRSELLNGRARGRATERNDVSRFERLTRDAVDDGWITQTEDLPMRRTEVSEERVRRAVTRNTSPDVSFDRSLNPYRGCEHGCIYCFARPSHAFLGMSPGLDFETRLIARPNAAEALERELRRPGYAADVLAIGTNTDAYQPIERERAIMRGVLEVLHRFRHPVSIVTKGSLIERDIDLIASMAEQGLACVSISVTTLDPKLSRQMEPRVPAPMRRLQTIARLAEAGIPVRVSASPMIPGLTDHELEAILQAGRDAGAQAASMIALRLPREVSELFEDWLKGTRPDAASKVMSLIRQMHGGKAYDPEFGHRMTGSGPYAEIMQKRFKAACLRLELGRNLPPLRRDLFEVPLAQGDQLSLF